MKERRLISSSRKKIKWEEHPEVGSEGHMVVYYTGAVSEGRAALMLVNKTDVDIKKDLNSFTPLVYDGKTFLIIKRCYFHQSGCCELSSIQQL